MSQIFHLAQKFIFRGYNKYHENLSDVVEKFNRNGIPIFLGTVASNLKDQAPLSDDPDVLALYESTNLLSMKEKDR